MNNPSTRDLKICATYQAVRSMRETGLEHDISKERVRQIVRKHAPHLIPARANSTPMTETIGSYSPFAFAAKRIARAAPVVPVGSCTAWIVTDGVADICGAECDRQVCDPCQKARDTKCQRSSRWTPSTAFA